MSNIEVEGKDTHLNTKELGDTPVGIIVIYFTRVWNQHTLAYRCPGLNKVEISFIFRIGKGRDTAPYIRFRIITFDFNHLLLERIFSELKENNPELFDTCEKKFSSKPPQLERVGTKKTRFTNFGDICKTYKRLPSHLMDFIFAELGTTYTLDNKCSGSIDANVQLLVDFKLNNLRVFCVNIFVIILIIFKIPGEFVLCHTCKSADSELKKENRLHFLVCNTCGSKCSVPNIKAVALQISLFVHYNL
ncbi:LOW QUALITY PROTEIN: hypothetical protein HZS_1050 [Henneguya salminicola]|nr:LOW QUALITY PROTEIN: hypothetical protein HZS_1050 [Henneguya salminicola]